MQRNPLAIEGDGERAQAWEPAALRPILDPVISDIVYVSPGALFELIRRYGSPLNMVWPQLLRRNVDVLRTVLRTHAVRFEIFYGAKVNKSQALMRAAVESGTGVDVSSVYELRDALRAGADPARLCATGPAKTGAFHAELIANSALISIDSLEEFVDLENHWREIAPVRPARVLLRYRPLASQSSRYGMEAGELLQCLQRLGRLKGQFAFEGFHFHLSGYAHEVRAQAVRELIPHIEAARRMGLEPAIVDVGGGLPVRYVDSDEYDAFLREHGAEHYRGGKVPASFYPYGSRIDAGEWLNRLLESHCVQGLSIARFFNAAGLTLALEPGRSLVDQAAISLFRIARVKSIGQDKHVIFVEGSSFSACETWFASEFLIDPILVSSEAAERRASAPARAYIAGHSCLDEDVITNRWVTFRRMPHAGDLLVFANTAGYQMDLLENEFHRHPMPRRIAVTRAANGGWGVLADEPKE